MGTVLAEPIEEGGGEGERETTKELTKEQKVAVSAANLSPDNWMLVEQTEFYLKIINKTSGKIRRVDRYAITKKGEKDEFRNGDIARLPGKLSIQRSIFCN